MDLNNIDKSIGGLDNEGLTQLEAAVARARADRNAIDINSIRPGMDADAKAKARDEIRRLLGGK